jgi:hypothetical protein
MSLPLITSRLAVRVTPAVGSLDGGSDLQLRVVTQARPQEFVGTKRLEEDWPGYGWRSVFSPSYFR